MAQFRFSLEILLKYREDIEQKERDELFRVTYNYQMALRARETLEQKRIETTRALSAKQSEGYDTQELNWYHLYLNRLEYELEECAKRLLKLDEEVQAQKKIVIEATKKRKVLSILKAKKQKEFILELDRKEQKEVEDWVITRYAAKETR